jgi:2-hydroxychromene-2-carboxylate isomerase
MSQPGLIAQVLDEAGLPAQEIIAATQNPAIKQALIEHTSASVARGTFGSPTFYVGEDIYFGKDRLRDVEELLLGTG